MCDYSLKAILSRPAQVGDTLAVSGFIGTTTRGFIEFGKPGTAVCLLPGTEVAFEADVAFDNVLGAGRQVYAERMARFVKIEDDVPDRHHDALEFPDGWRVLLTRLAPGQRATVLQLPVKGDEKAALPEEKKLTMRELMDISN